MISPNNPPTSPDGLLKLAERCEQATGPCRALDREISEVVYPVDKDMARAFRPTKSMDSAILMVPQGTGWSIGYGIVPGVGEGPQFFSAVQVGPDLQVCAGYATPALTLCAAALKARASQ
jgi:hypothetical protein